MRISSDSAQTVSQEIIEGKLSAIVDEMGVVMARTSMSPVIYEVLDFACGLLTEHGELVAQMNGITLFTGTFGAQVRGLINKFNGDLQEGDVLLTNDPYSGGTHANDIAVVKPLFVNGKVFAFAVNVAHYLDVGGSVPGSLAPDATSVFQEGLRLPGVKVVRSNVFSSELLHIISANVRLPALALGDLNAQIATVRVAEKRVAEMVYQYGRETLDRAFSRLLDTSELQTRAAIRALPDGTYYASDTIDGDGVNTRAINVCVAVTIDGDAMTVDFTGCPPATEGPINCSRGALESAVKTIVKALVAPQAQSNDGWFRPVKTLAPAGTIFTAELPSPTGWYYEGSCHASELVWKALAPLAPEWFSAGAYTSLCALYLSGVDESGQPYIHVEPQHGGWGAAADRDGASAVIALTDGDTYNYSIEVIESKFPLRVTRYSLNTEAGVGHGRYRGGFGVIREYEILGDSAVAHASFGRTVTRPWAMDGGGPGSPNALYVNRAGGGQQESYGRVSHVDLQRGDRLRVATGGGGGWGDPTLRDSAQLSADLEAGLIDRLSDRTVHEQLFANIP